VTRVTADEAAVMKKLPKTPCKAPKEYYPLLDQTAYTGGMSPARGTQTDRAPPLHWSVEERVHARPVDCDVLSDEIRGFELSSPRLRALPSSKRSIMATRFCMDGSEDFERPLRRNVTDSMRELEGVKHQLQKMALDSAKQNENDRVGLGHDMTSPVPPVSVAAVCPLHQLGRDMRKEMAQGSIGYMQAKALVHSPIYMPTFGPEMTSFVGSGQVRHAPRGVLGVTFYHVLSQDEIARRKWRVVDELKDPLADVAVRNGFAGGINGTSNPLSLQQESAWRGPMLTDLGRGSAKSLREHNADIGPAIMKSVMGGGGKSNMMNQLPKLQKGSPTSKLTEARLKLAPTSSLSSPAPSKQQKPQGSQPRKTVERPPQPEDSMSNAEIARRFFNFAAENADPELAKKKRREEFTGKLLGDVAGELQGRGGGAASTASGVNWWEEDKALVRKDATIFPLLGQIADFFAGPGLTLPGMTKELEPVVARLSKALTNDALNPEHDIGITSRQVTKLRALADCMRLLAKKNGNLDMRICCLICKICCTRLLKKRTGIVFSKVLKTLQRMAIEIGDERNHNVNGAPGVKISPHLIGLFSELAAEVRRQNTGATLPADQILAADSIEAIKSLAAEIAVKVDELNGADIYKKAWKAKIDRVFDIMDRDGSGFVHQNELERMYKPEVVAERTKKFLVEEMLEKFDKDSDGRVSYAEWVCFVSEAEKSGRYSVEELQVELGFFLKGTGASRIGSLEF